jgi:hypothetical protein
MKSKYDLINWESESKRLERLTREVTANQAPTAVVYPKTWKEAYKYLKQNLLDPSAPTVSFRDLPSDGLLPSDEIVAAQPMTTPAHDDLFEFTYSKKGN